MQDKLQKNPTVLIGIDPSMRSTGICIWTGEEHKYYLIAAKPTKKLLKFKHQNLKVIPYNPVEVKNKTAIGKENAKTDNVATVCHLIEKILYIYKPSRVTVEAIAYGANGRIDELAGLNYCIRLIAKKLDIPVYAVSPTTNKMEFTGNGQATKEMMVTSWQACDPRAVELCDIGKGPDDLADAYALCHFPKDKLILEN